MATIDDEYNYYKHCRSKRCKRKEITVYAPARKYCIECGGKLRRGTGTDDSPPVVDGPDNPNERHPLFNTNVNLRGNMQKPKDPVTWQQFPGNHEAYMRYLQEFRADDFKEFNPFGVKVGPRPADGNPTQLTVVPRPVTPSDEFVCSTPDVEGCPLQKNSGNSLIEIPNNMYQTWVWLAKAIKTEWIAYLKGTQDATTKVWTITEMYFPKQRANGGHVDAEDGQIVEGTIGSVHSHVAMGAFFSAEDKAHFNHPVEIVVNNKGDLAMCVRLTLDCGRFTRVSTGAVLIGNDEQQATLADLRSKLTEQQMGYKGGASAAN